MVKVWGSQGPILNPTLFSHKVLIFSDRQRGGVVMSCSFCFYTVFENLKKCEKSKEGL